MNVLFVNDIAFNPSYGGIERVTDNIVKGLIALGKGYNFYYLFFKTHKREILQYEFPARIFECPSEGGFDSTENIEYYIDILNEYRIDVVVNQRGSISIMNKAISLTQRSKVVSVIHSDINYWVYRKRFLYHHTCNQSLATTCKYILKKTNPYLWSKYVSWTVKPYLKSHYNEIANISDAIVVLSKQYIKDVESYNEDSNTKIYSIPNPNTFCTQDVDFSLMRNEILYIGRLDSTEKAPMLLLQIWRKIYKKHLDWKLVIVGEGYAKDEMIAYVDKHKLPRVFFEGAKCNVEDYYKSASLVCLTSVSEGWGMALTEGMTYGCVPFTFNNSGSSYDIIDNDINGCLISAYNINEYAKRLSYVISNKSKRFAMGKCALEKSKMFSVENVVRQWDVLFENIV